MGTQQGLDVSKSPTAGTLAQVPPGVQTAYKEAADTMGEAGVGGVGATDAISLDVMAAQEIINDQIASTGTVDAKVLKNLSDATDLSIEELGTMVANAGSRVIGTETIPVDIPGGVSDALIDQPTGIGGGSNIQVTPLPSGETLLTNNDTGRQTVVDQGANLQEAIATFDEVTTPIDEQTVALREQAAAEINRIPVFSSVQGTGGITDAAVDVITSKMDADAAATSAPEIVEDTGFAPEQQLEMLLSPEQTQQLDLLALTEPEPEPEPAPAPAPEEEPSPAPEPEEEPAPAPEVEVEPEPEPEPPVVVEVGPDEDDTDEGEEVEVELEPEEPDVEDEPDVEPPTDIFVPPVVTTDDDGNEVTECPEGYRMVTTGEGPMCMKSFSMERQRAGAGTRAYTGLAGNIGRRGPGQRRKVTTQTQRVRPTVRRT
jgi:outer membrane biosynthesis protein TonB